jgi:hypothetical protein
MSQTRKERAATGGTVLVNEGEDSEKERADSSSCPSFGTPGQGYLMGHGGRGRRRVTGWKYGN